MEPSALLDRCRFPAHDVLRLGVSGGADSVAMAFLAQAAHRRFEIWHVDHGLRASSGDDAERVGKLAAEMGVPYELRTVVIDDGPDLEARARSARYEALPADVCVAHTADDRAETVLINLFRGAGLAGVAASFDRVHRPLLALRRAETEAVCSAAGVVPVLDEHNDDPRFTRVRVRSELLPLAVEIFGRDPVPLLNRHADLAADAVAQVEEAAAGIDGADVATVRELPVAVARQVLRSWLLAETEAGAPVDLASIERVRRVVAGEAVATEIEGGHRVARSAGRLRVDRPASDG